MNKSHAESQPDLPKLVAEGNVAAVRAALDAGELSTASPAA